MTYNTSLRGGLVRLTSSDEPIIADSKALYGDTTFEVLEVKHYKDETYPVYRVRSLDQLAEFRINGRFLDDATLPYEGELRLRAVNSLKAYVEYVNKQGKAVDIEGLLL